VSAIRVSNRVRDIRGGAHVDVATVFADMRGSTPTAERIGDRAFSELIDRFSKTSSKILIDAGAIVDRLAVDRLAGDRAIGYFVPGFAGPTYAQAALDAAVELLRATGHNDEDGRGFRSGWECTQVTPTSGWWVRPPALRKGPHSAMTSTSEHDGQTLQE